jgi:hypothetical protein
VTEGPLPTDVLAVIDDAALKAQPKWPPYFYENLGDALAVSSIDAATAYYGEMRKLLTTRTWLAGDCSFADISFYMASLFWAASKCTRHGCVTEASGVAGSHDAATCGALCCQRHGKLAACSRAAGAGIHEPNQLDDYHLTH